MTQLRDRIGLMDPATGMVSRTAFSDEDLHVREQEMVFRRTWLFLAHESSISGPDSFLATTMGEDPVIVWRGKDSRVRAFLNTCPHRGAAVCIHDRGKAPHLRCSYHGWTFDSQGRLVGVPFEKRAYGDSLDRDSLGLVQVPRVESYGGLVFGCWNPEAPSLASHLGDLRWWLDAFICSDDLGGMVALPGCQRYMTNGNWKLFCDNFVGDRYHTPTSHASAVKLGLARPASPQGEHGYFMAFMEPAHGVGGFFTDSTQYERDLEQAAKLGPDAVEFVRERWSLRQRRLAATPDKPSHFSFGLGFPSFLLQGIGGALRGNLIGVCHPRGLHAAEISQWVLVERDAPDSVKRATARFVSRGQSAGGMVGPDDTENFDRIDQSMRSPAARHHTVHYGMGQDLEGRWSGQERWRVEGLPGLVGPEFWEVGQRRFYKHWAALMDLDGDQ